MFRRALISVLDVLFKSGTLVTTFANGEIKKFGDGTGAPVHIRFVTSKAERSMLFNPGLAFPEGYMDGTIEFLAGDPMAFLTLLYGRNKAPGATTWRYRMMDWFRLTMRRFFQINTLRQARKNAAHHYDLDLRLYDLFLDPDRQYSCAYYESPEASLEEAQRAKIRHLVSKLHLQGGESVLEIGCGWGGMALYLAKFCQAKVTGVTLSQEQYQEASRLAAGEDGSPDAKFLLSDYRNVDGKFDRILSVAMLEAVGLGHYEEYFRKCRSLLSDDGVLVVHSVGKANGPGFTHPFIRKYIFPGGHAPALSEIIPIIEKAGFFITDIEILRLHYAETLKAWRENFMANRDKAREIYDDRFCRMWEFYLAGFESAFRYQYLMNFQIQMTPKRETLPLTRTYMAEAEEKLRKISEKS